VNMNAFHAVSFFSSCMLSIYDQLFMPHQQACVNGTSLGVNNDTARVLR